MNNIFSASEICDFKVSSGLLQIQVHPVDPIFDRVTLRLGDTIWGNRSITVSNTGNIAFLYWFFTEWMPVPPTTPQQAFKAVNMLKLTINKVDPPFVNIYTGSLINLFDWPPGGRFLPDSFSEKLRFILSLPLNNAISYFHARIKINFLFVSEQA